MVYRDTLKNYGGADVGSISQRDGFSLAEPKTSPKLGARILARGMGSNPILFTFLLRANGVSSRQVGDALFARKTAAPIYYAKTHTTHTTNTPPFINHNLVGRSVGVAAWNWSRSLYKSERCSSFPAPSIHPLLCRKNSPRQAQIRPVKADAADSNEADEPFPETQTQEPHRRNTNRTDHFQGETGRGSGLSACIWWSP